MSTNIGTNIGTNISTSMNNTEHQPREFPGAIYQEYFPLMKKTIWARKVDINLDLDIIHTWMNRPHVEEFWHMAWSKERIADYLEKAQAKQGFDCYVIYVEDEPMAYFELYHPHSDPVGATYDVQEGDLGLHVLIGEEKYQRRYIIRLSALMMRLIFNYHPDTLRVIGEPDVNNTQIQGVMKFVGFRFMNNVTLPDKIGALHSLRREDFEQAHGPVKAA